MRHTLALLVATTLLTTPALAVDLASVRTITVTGQAERKVVPDEAHINFTVSATNMKLATAKSEHDEKLRKTLALLKTADIEEAQIKTNSASTEPQYSYESNKQIFKGYRVTTNLDITVDDMESVGAVMEKLSNSGLENKTSSDWGSFMNVSYTISEPQKIRDEMSAEAIKNARAKAEQMAAAAGASLGAVYQVTEGNTPNFMPPRPMMAMAKLASADAAPITPPAGEESVTASVTITYELQ